MELLGLHDFFDFFSKYENTKKEDLFNLIVKRTKKKFFFVFCVFDHHHREDSITNFFGIWIDQSYKENF
jgi:hypothetical protein